MFTLSNMIYYTDHYVVYHSTYACDAVKLNVLSKLLHASLSDITLTDVVRVHYWPLYGSYHNRFLHYYPLHEPRVRITFKFVSRFTYADRRDFREYVAIYLSTVKPLNTVNTRPRSVCVCFRTNIRGGSPDQRPSRRKYQCRE